MIFFIHYEGSWDHIACFLYLTMNMYGFEVIIVFRIHFDTLVDM